MSDSHTDQEFDAESRPFWRKRWFTISVVVTGLAVIMLSVWFMQPGSSYTQPLVYYQVKKTDLRITVTERGNLESQQKIDIRCEVENLGGDRSSGSGTQILSIIPNGASVKEGDLLVELDAAPLRERLDTQVLATEKARAEQIQADVKYKNQITQNETALAEAKLQVDLAKLDVENFEDDQGGTFQIELQDINMKIQQERAAQLIQNTELVGVERLYKLGYRNKGDLDAAKLQKMGSDSQLAKSLSQKIELTNYQYRKRKLELGGQLATAERALIQVTRDNESELAQAKARLDAADRALKKEVERHKHYENQLKLTKIYAPKDGMVTYAVPTRYSRSSEVREGAFVRQRQKLLSLPSLRRMQVTTAVHESVLDQVRPGLKATVRIDMFPNKRYKATVTKVAVLPDRGGWLSSDTKVYSTTVRIDEDVDKLKPGMTAVVEIHVDHLDNVISIPVQSVVQSNGETWVYVDNYGRVNRKPVELGKTNDKFVEITKGLEAGEQVVLNPMSIVDESRDSNDKAEPSDKDKTESDKTESPEFDERDLDPKFTSMKEKGGTRSGSSKKSKKRKSGRTGD